MAPFKHESGGKSSDSCLLSTAWTFDELRRQRCSSARTWRGPETPNDANCVNPWAGAGLGRRSTISTPLRPNRVDWRFPTNI